MPFPAVTVCSINRIQHKNILRMSQRLLLPKGTTKENFINISYLLLEMTAPSKDMMNDDIILLQNILDLNNLSVGMVMKKVSPQCDQLLFRCLWKGRIHKGCSSLFTRVKTFDGYCCAFNYQGLNNVLYKKTTKQVTAGERIADRISGTGYRKGLSVAVKTSSSDYYATSLSSYGIKVMIHNPYSFADGTESQKIISKGEQTFISVRPTEKYAAKEVRSISIEKRRCSFQNEASLVTMQVYTYTNCFMECQFNYTVKLCGCVPYYYPNAGITRKCNLTDLPCLTRYHGDIMSIFPTDFGTEVIDLSLAEKLPCNCLPGCSHISFRIDASEVRLLTDMTLKVDSSEFYAGIDPEEHSIFHVYFGDLMGTRYRMQQYYTWLDLLAAFGGLLSLSLGASIISAVEFIYFFTIRNYFNLLKNDITASPSELPEKEVINSVRVSHRTRRHTLRLQPAYYSREQLY